MFSIYSFGKEQAQAAKSTIVTNQRLQTLVPSASNGMNVSETAAYLAV